MRSTAERSSPSTHGSSSAMVAVTADRDGFLYFFANDSAFAYSNNSGYLDVTVSRLG